MKPKRFSFRYLCHVRNTTQRIKSLCMVNADTILLRTFTTYCKYGGYCGPVPVECRLPLAALQLTSVRVTAREMTCQLNNNSHFCSINSSTSFTISIKDDTGLSCHKLQFLLIHVHLNILHQLYVLCFVNGY